MAKAGANSYTWHVEAVATNEERKALIKSVRDAGMKCGISVKPGTSVEALLPYCEELDAVLVMTVEPGFGGEII